MDHGPHVWRANNPRNHIYLLNGDGAEKSGVCEVPMGLCDWANWVWSYRLMFLCLSIVKTVEQWWLWCCHYRQRRKGTLAWTDTIPPTIEDHKLFQNCGFTHWDISINADGEEETENHEWEGVIESLTFVATTVNFKPENKQDCIMRSPISFRFSMHCW